MFADDNHCDDGIEEYYHRQSPKDVPDDYIQSSERENNLMIFNCLNIQSLH